MVSSHSPATQLIMKKFKFVLGFAALAMLGACSSEEPALNGGTTDDPVEKDMKYLTVKIDGAHTRANGEDATKHTLDSENETVIEKVQMIVMQGATEFLNVTATKIDDNNFAIFPVHQATYTQLKEKQAVTSPAGGEKFDVYLYVNGINLTSSAQLLSSSGDDGKTQDLRLTSSEKPAKPFIMSNADVATGNGMGIQLLAPGTATGTEDDPWQIYNTIYVARLASRFDYQEENSNKYTAISDKNLKMEVGGFAVVTYATKTYRLPWFSADGTTKDMQIFSSGLSTAYPVTESYQAKEENDEFYKKMNESDFSIRPAEYQRATDSDHGYFHPNTITKDQSLSFKTVPYVVIRAAFYSDKFKTSMDAGEDVFALNGYLLGGIAELRTLKTNGTEFKIEHDYTAGSVEAEAIKAVETAVNSAINRTDFVETNTNTMAKIKAQFMKYSGAISYSAIKDEGPSKGKYYTYYARYIKNEKLGTATNGQKYGVLRNTIYRLSVASFTKLGSNGSNYPGNDPEDVNLDDQYLKFKIEVKDWEINDKNTNLAL